MQEQSVQRVSRSRVTLAPQLITKEEIQEFTPTMTDEELGTDYPTKENVNMNYLPRSDDDDKEDVEHRRSSLLRQLNNKNTNYHNCIDLGLDDD